MGTTSGVIAILSVIVISMAPDIMGYYSEMGNTIGCHRKIFHDVIVQRDKIGRKCSDWVSVWGCQGRCRSEVIGDWKFPYKIYFHRVCIHGQRNKTTTKLKNCDPGVTPGTEIYEYTEAIDCSCSICSSSDTSCEGIRKRGPPSLPVLQKNDDVTDNAVMPVETAKSKWSYLSPPPLLPSLYP